MENAEPTAVVKRFVEAFDAQDTAVIADCLGDDLVAEVTQKDASTIQLHGRDAYMANLESIGFSSVELSVAITQIAEVSAEQVLFMIEGRILRKGRKLHNHAAYLMTITEGKIRRIWMVEALPEESDIFWKS